MERRVLIVDSQGDFALSMASVLKSAGYQTAMASSAADAVRELEKRRPDLVVLRAELPDQSGFVLCGQIKKGRFGPALPVLMLSSDIAHEGLAQHSQGNGAADAYLSIPFEMADLAQLTAQIIPLLPAPKDEMDDFLNFEGDGSQPTRNAPPTPPPIRTALPGAPPKLPRRERRSAITEEDRTFLDRAFQSVAERKAELIAESHQTRRSPPRREAMGTPEGKVQILREELKFREAQLARISEIWGVRERELLSVEDRLHEKDVELQGLKMQVDDLLRRFNEAQQSMVQKEREHGATVDDLLLQKFATEKDLIEVVASKEKDINVLRKEISYRDEELAQSRAELETARANFEQIEKQFGLATLEFEVKEQSLNQTVQERNLAIEELGDQLKAVRTDLAGTISERDTGYAKWEKDYRAKTEQLEQAKQEREGTVAALEGRIAAAEERSSKLEEQLETSRSDRAKRESELREQIGSLETTLSDTQGERELLRLERDHLTRSSAEQLAERDGKIQALEQELETNVQQREKDEARLNEQVQQKLEQIGELEAEVESARLQLEEREQELNRERAELRKTERELTLSVEEERQAHSKTREEAAQQIAQLQRSAGEAQQSLDELAEQLSAAKQELGARIAEATQLTSDVAEAENQRAGLHENIETLSQEFRRREEFLQSDLATRTIELADLQQKLTGLTQEKQRHGESLSRELAAKTEQLKQWEAKFRLLGDDGKKKQEDTARQLETLSKELLGVRSELLDTRKKVQAATDGRTQVLAEREKLREALTALQQQQQAQRDELSRKWQAEKAEYAQSSQRATAQQQQLARLNQEQQARLTDLETKQKEGQAQLAIRARKVQELESAVENLHGVKSRLEKEVHAKVAAAEEKAKDLTVKLNASVKDRKDYEFRHQKDLEELAAKHKLESERREAVKGQEVLRLQQAVQEKSKALKVAELELARYKGKPSLAGASKPLSTPAEPSRTSGATAALGVSGANSSKPRPVAAAKPAPAPARPAPAKSPLIPQGEEEQDEWSRLVDELDK